MRVWVVVCVRVWFVTALIAILSARLETNLSLGWLNAVYACISDSISAVSVHETCSMNAAQQSDPAGI